MGVDKTFLLICDKTKTIIPVCDATFSLAQSPLSKKRTEYIGCKIIRTNGEIREIRSIEKVGYFGNSRWSKILSALNGTYMVNVVFGSAEVLDLPQLKSKLIELTKLDSSSADPYLPQEVPIDVVIENIRNASSIEGVFISLNLPSVEDCLDVL